MKNSIKQVRILKIKAVKDFVIHCIFNNGETRIIDFMKLFRKWRIGKQDPEYCLLNKIEFRKVSLRNNTLSWKNVKISLVDSKGRVTIHPYELSPDILYENSTPSPQASHRYFFGKSIRNLRLEEGLSQNELAKLSGTSKTYISRIENDQIEPELTTLYKIVELGLGKKLRIRIE